MANVRISDLTAVASSIVTDELEVNQGGVSKKATLAQLLAAAGSTSVTIASAATTLSIGAATGTATINNASVVLSGNLTISGTAGNAIGGAVNVNAQLNLRGAFSGNTGNAQGLLINASYSPVANAVAYGINVAPTLVEAGSGVHAEMGSVVISAPTITDNGATTTTAFALKLNSAPTVGAANHDLWAASTTEGAHRIDGGTTGAQTATFSATNKPGTGTAGPATWLPVNVDGTVRYIPCFGA